jgi:thiol-disulfide isomerase/thioredoxin
VLADRSVKGWGSELGVVDGSETSAKARSASGARSPAGILLVALVSGLAGFGAVYVTWGRPDNGAPASPSLAAVRETPSEAAPRPGIHPLSTGEMTAFRFHPEPRDIYNVRFVDGSGAARSLSDWKGKVVLLNLWATWCAPCRKEMPALDRLQKALGSDGFEVVALNLDRGGVETAKKFLDQIKIEALKLYADPSTRASTELNAVGMPTTILIDRDGRELGRIVGPAEWDGADAQRLIAASLR